MRVTQFFEIWFYRNKAPLCVRSGDMLISTRILAHQIDWLLTSGSKIVEIYCQCSPSIAADRFLNRDRHIGHLDTSRTKAELVREFNELDALGPLNCGTLIEINTESTIDPHELSHQIRISADA